MKLDLTSVRTDGGTQPRAQLDGVTVSEYADAMRRGDDFPPVKVMHDGENYWLYDGFHRVQAARQIGREKIDADVEQGTKEDAQWASLAANKRHGLRRTQKDKRRAIKRALKGWGTDKSDREIARHVGCDHKTVGKYRDKQERTGEIPQSEKRTGADGRTIDTSNIGGSSGSQTSSGDGSTTEPEPDIQKRAERGKQKAEAAGKTPEDATSDLLDKAVPDDGGTPTSERQQKRQERKQEYQKRREIEPFPESGSYGLIYADPPWQYDRDALDEYGHVGRHYDTMTPEDIGALPVQPIIRSDCALFLWATSPKLPQAIQVLTAWGFDYKTSFVWDKVKHNHGHYNSVRHELLLVGGVGSATPETSKLYDSVQSVPKSDVHSEKPDHFRTMIDTLYPSCEKIELFARNEPKGELWSAWGDEV